MTQSQTNTNQLVFDLNYHKLKYGREKILKILKKIYTRGKKIGIPGWIKPRKMSLFIGSNPQEIFTNCPSNSCLQYLRKNKFKKIMGKRPNGFAGIRLVGVLKLKKKKKTYNNPHKFQNP